MTKNLFFLALFGLCACQIPLSPQQEQAARVALAKKAKHAQGVSDEPITTSTRFAARCPYCDQVCFSWSCLPSGGRPAPAIGGRPADGKVIQTWSISYKCRSCGMSFSDSREQTVEATKSIRLPIVGQ